MKILTVCEGGNVRSVGMAWTLKNQGHNAVAVGSMYAFASHNDRQPGFMLCQWADVIIPMADYILKGTPIPQDCVHKVKVCDVGQDTYGNPFHPNLQEQISAWLKESGL